MKGDHMTRTELTDEHFQADIHTAAATVPAGWSAGLCARPKGKQKKHTLRNTSLAWCSASFCT
jgi:hypothetical protein